MEGSMRFDVFISYRRDGGELLGRLLFEMLKNKYRVFFDHESLSSGRFDTKLLQYIEGAKDVIVILSNGCFDRCANQDDWFMQEIKCALQNDKNIILLMTDDFIMPAGKALEAFPPEIATLVKYNGHRATVAYIDSVIGKLSHDLKATPLGTEDRFGRIGEWRQIAEAMNTPALVTPLPEEVKRDVLLSASRGMLGDYHGEIYASVLDRAIRTKSNVRTKYRYEIEIDTEFDFRLTDTDPEKYNVLTESFAYSKKFLNGAPAKTFWISFGTDLDELDASLRAEDFFFSENLMIEKADMDMLSALDEDEKEEFYRSVMRVKININGTVLTPEKVIIDASGIFGQYAFSEELLASSDTFDVKIRFRIPQKKGNSYFFASINDPTFSPFIRFTYPEEDFDVTMIPFLNRSVTSKDSKIFDGLRELSVENEWILPISGAIFVITQHI